MKEPTPEDCTTHKTWTDSEGYHHLAFWWPQMGGYVGKAVARVEPLSESDRGDCVMVWIWHDGEFPFSESEGIPAVLHICDFGDWLSTLELLFKFQSGESIPEIPLPLTTIISGLQ